jgi:2-dehydropantoate 2-reductase
MKVGIVGAGAMGSIFAYFFNKANISTVLFEKDSNIIKNMKDGLKILADSKTENIKVEVGDNPLVLKDCETIFIFVKIYDTEEAVQKIAPGIDKKTIIVSLQNGIGSKEILAKYIQEERIVYGSTSIGATRINSNSVRLGGMGDIVIGGSKKESVAAVGRILKEAGLNVIITVNPDEAIWKKAIINAAINPLGALLGVPNGEIVKNEYSRTLQEKIVREAVEVANSIGLPFNSDEMVKQTKNVCEKTEKNLCSMLQDVNAGRRTEIDNINGIIIQYGEKNSIPTPYNDAVYCLIKAKELL